MSLYSKIKGLSYEMEEYLYELQHTTSESEPQRVDFLVKEYKKDLINFLDLTGKDLKSLSKEQKEEVLELNFKYNAIYKNLIIAEEAAEKIRKTERVNLYPDHLNELICALLGKKKIKKEEYSVTEESVVSHFIEKKDLKRLSKLEKKYKLKKIKLTDYLCDIIEKMYSFAPF